MKSSAKTFRIQVRSSGAQGAVMALARAFNVSLDAARRLLSVPRVLPRAMEEAEAGPLLELLRRHGVRCELVPVVGAASAMCEAHPSLSAERPCEQCRSLVCVLCVDAAGRALCERCAARGVRRSRAQWVRVAVLLAVLGGVVTWGISRHRAQEQRLAWSRPLEVAVVLVASGPVAPEVRQAWATGLEQLQAWVARQAAHYDLALAQPVRFELARPVRGSDFHFEAPASTGWGRLLQARRWRKALSAVDAEAGVSGREWDARIYVVLEEGKRGEPRLVEGLAEAGGSLGLVRGLRADTQLTLELTAVAHELFHCLGALDAYDENGHARVPEGLVQPRRDPLYPQAAAEVMVGEVPTGQGQGRLPNSLDEVGVGPTTAEALRWTK